MGVSKVEYFGNSLVDLTEDTVTASTLLEGYTAHDMSGELIRGTYSPVTEVDQNLFFYYSFNGPVKILDVVTSCVNMFFNYHYFNQPVNVPDSVTNCINMFYNCQNFDQEVHIGSGVTTATRMFFNCVNMAANVYIDRTTTMSCVNMFRARNVSRSINLFCNNIAILKKTAQNTSPTGYATTWTEVTNGFYNKKYNMYIYNNYIPGVGPIP